MVEVLPAMYYRILRSDMPAEADFVMWSGESVSSSLDEAQATARQYPNLGPFIGRVQLPPNRGGTIRVERTSDADEE